MSAPSAAGRRHSTDGLERLGVAATLRRSSVDHRVLRGLVVIGAACTLVSTMAAIGTVQPVAAMLVGVLALGSALSTDGHTVLLTAVVLAVNWLTAVDDTTSPWVVPAAIGLVVMHSAAAALTVAPPAATLDRRTVRRWAGRTAAVSAVAPLTWAATLLADGWSDTGVAVVLVAALVGVTALATWVRSRSVPVSGR